ncbi:MULTISPECIES: type VI immunity family protein [unclassified Acinetobacter]|uniref:type VI immunity family protein n=1 Tax=unclassified Acinetobacter TaxID=196816 RepID=UPI0015D37D45|nr:MULTISPECIES: type VI immunity family protein [unclassified Acinetobacter]
MSTAQVYLNDEEIEELVRDIPLDTSIIYGEEKKEFGVCPYITFYIDQKKTNAQEFLIKVIDIYEKFEFEIIDKPFHLRFRCDTEVWKKAISWIRSREEISAEMAKIYKKYFIYYLGATSAQSQDQSPRWALSAKIRDSSERYSSLKLTFGDQWYRSNKDIWYSFVQKCLEMLNPIQAYSGYEIGNTSQFAFVSPEFETVERTFTDYFYGLDIDHPGMEFSHENMFIAEDRDGLGGGIRTPTWCFLLSPYWLEKLGLSEEQIREKLDDPRIEITKIIDLEDSTKYSLWIRLGELSLYPVEEGVPDLLVMANELIKPIRCDNLKLTTLDAWSDDPNPRFDAVSSKQWIARFDEDSTWPELKRVKVEVQEPERIDIVIAGSPCPHAGYWYTFAKENSRQYFKQGDIFPDFESDWGDVYWQFDGEE